MYVNINALFLCWGAFFGFCDKALNSLSWAKSVKLIVAGYTAEAAASWVFWATVNVFIYTHQQSIN